MPRPVRHLAIALFLASATLACNDESTSAPIFPGALRVLFIGNSLTYSNDLPHTFSALASSAGVDVSVESVALPNYALIDHAYGQSDALSVIAQGGWTHVVLQQGPTWPGLCGDTLTLATRLLDEEIRRSGGRTALLMTWPSSVDSQYFGGVVNTYSAAAEQTNAILIPAGVAWRDAWHEDAELPLYSADGYHPSRLGTYLTALVVYERLLQRDARGLPGAATVEGRSLDASESTLRMLQRIAHDANGRAGGPAVDRTQPARSRLRASITC